MYVPRIGLGLPFSCWFFYCGVVASFGQSSADNATSFWLSPSLQATVEGHVPTIVAPQGMWHRLYVWGRPDATNILESWTLNIHFDHADSELNLPPVQLELGRIEVFNPLLNSEGGVVVPCSGTSGAICRYEIVHDSDSSSEIVVARENDRLVVKNLAGLNIINDVVMGVGIGPEIPLPPSDPLYVPDRGWPLASFEYRSLQMEDIAVWIGFGSAGIKVVDEPVENAMASFGGDQPQPYMLNNPDPAPFPGDSQGQRPEAMLDIRDPSLYFTADFSGGLAVDRGDLIIWSMHYGEGPDLAVTRSHGDADLDLDVDGYDFLHWQRQYGMSIFSVLASHRVPEPSTVLILLTASGCYCLSCTRRSRHEVTTT